MKKLELKFKNEDGKTVTYSIENPIEPVEAASVTTAMDEIISQNAFTSNGGDLVSKMSARVVENIVQDIDLGL